MRCLHRNRCKWGHSNTIAHSCPLHTLEGGYSLTVQGQPYHHNRGHKPLQCSCLHQRLWQRFWAGYPDYRQRGVSCWWIYHLQAFSFHCVVTTIECHVHSGNVFVNKRRFNEATRTVLLPLITASAPAELVKPLVGLNRWHLAVPSVHVSISATLLDFRYTKWRKIGTSKAWCISSRG